MPSSSRTFTIIAALAFAFSAALPAAAQTDLARKDDRPLEAIQGIESDYGAVRTSEGLTLRTIVTRPSGSTTPLPAIFFTQWVSCGSIEFDDGPDLLKSLARQSGLALIRVERAGTGDSEGASCDTLDYDTEVRHYREAFDALASHPWVDPVRIVIYGSSLGSTTAPLVAQGKNVAGVLVQGGGALTYFERMAHFDRQQLERNTPFVPKDIHREMVRRFEFQRHYLHGRMTPEAIAAQYPDLAGVWDSLLGTDERPHYGRPHAWHWQAAQKDWLSAWTEIDAPVMVVYGEYDQFEPRHGHRIIVDTVNRLRPGTATWLEIPKAGHGLRIYPDRYAAYRWENGERRPELFLSPVIGWLRMVTHTNPAD